MIFPIHIEEKLKIFFLLTYALFTSFFVTTSLTEEGLLTIVDLIEFL